MIISTDMEEKYDKVQHTLMIRTLNKLGLECNLLNIIKDLHGKPTTNILPSGDRQARLQDTRLIYENQLYF